MSTLAFLFNTNELKNSRLAWIDMAKGLAIIMVVFRHIVIGIERSGIPIDTIYRTVGEVTYSFRMPLFFMLSGFFIRASLQKRSNPKFINTKLKTLLYPYVVWTFIQITLQIIFSNYTNATRSWHDYIAVFISPRSIDQFWFIYALFNLAIVYLYMHQLTKGNKVVLFAIGIVFYYLNRFIDIPVIDDILQNFIYVVIGDLISGFILNTNNESTIKSGWVFLLALVCFLTSQYFYLTYVDLEPFVYAIIAIIGSILTLIVSFHMAGKKFLFFINVAGYHSLYIYLMHVLISAPIRVVLWKFMGITNGGFIALISTTLACMLPIVFYSVCKRYNMLFFFYPSFGSKKSL